jgi:hypothetical protein
MFVKIDGNRKQIAAYSDYAGQDSGLLNVDQLTPDKYHSLKTDYEDFIGADQWEIASDDNTKAELIAEISKEIDNQVAIQLSSGLEFENNTFPLIGNNYSHNMAAATAYIVQGLTGGRDLLTIDGNYATVTDIPGLLTAGDTLVTGVIKSAVDQKTALQSNTNYELYEMLGA